MLSNLPGLLCGQRQVQRYHSTIDMDARSERDSAWGSFSVEANQLD